MAKYVIGDLCNCLSDDEWEAFCNRDVIPDGVYIFRTAYGDGTYIGSDGFAYGVDSGTIGICPLDKVSDQEKLRTALKYRIVNVIEVPAVSEADCYEEDGVIRLGEIIIDTAA